MEKCKLKVLLQFSLLVNNYYILIGLAVYYKIIKQDTLFHILFTFIVAERIVNYLRGIYLHILQSGPIGVIKCLIFNLLFIDQSIQYGVYEETVYFDQNLFLKRLNILSHTINIIPIISNCWILLNTDSLDYVCLITTVYGLFHINLTNFMNNQREQQRNQNYIFHIYRIFVYASKNISYFLILAQLISYSYGFISIYALLILQEIFFFWKNIFTENLNGKLILQIQMIFSYKALEYLDQGIDSQLFNNFIQYSTIIVLFVFKSILLDLDTSIVNIIIYSAMFATILEFALSMYNIYQYKTKGPYEIYYQNKIESSISKQTMEDIVRDIERASLSHRISVELEINNSNNSNMEQVYSFVQYLLRLQKREKILSLLLNQKDENDQNEIKIFSFQKQSRVQVNSFEQSIFKQNVQNFVKTVQDNQLDYQQHQYNFIIKDSKYQEISLQRVFLDECKSFYPRSFQINGKDIPFLNYFNRVVIQFKVIQNQLQPLLPINLFYILYDLYD
ncbi:hypothetical protein ABPG74_008191 [Tetrahymena malaccensis]